MCQRFVRGVREVEAGVQGVMEQISVLKPPNSPDLERVHSAIDQCQVCSGIMLRHPAVYVGN